MPDYGEFSSSSFLRKEDVPENDEGERAAVVTIRSFTKEEMPNEGTKKWCVWFEEFPKPMTMNSTNGQVLKDCFGGNNTDAAIGKRVVLYVDKTVRDPNGKVVGGLRLKGLPRKKAAAPPPARQPGDDEGEEAFA